MAIPANRLKLDAKKRITLGKYAPDDVTSYEVEAKDDGTIILHPMVELSAHETWLYRNPEALKGVLEGMEDVKAGRVTYMDFSQYADEEIE